MDQCNFLHLWHQKLYRAFRFGTLWPISCSYPRHSQLTRHSLMLANGRIRQSLTALVVLGCGTEWNHCGLVMSNGVERSWSTQDQLLSWCMRGHYLIQCWFLISRKFCDICLTLISQRVPKLLFCIMSLKIVVLKLLPHTPGCSELNNLCHFIMNKW